MPKEELIHGLRELFQTTAPTKSARDARGTGLVRPKSGTSGSAGAASETPDLPEMMGSYLPLLGVALGAVMLLVAMMRPPVYLPMQNASGTGPTANWEEDQSSYENRYENN